MDSMVAFARGEAARAAGARQRVFDWDRAAQRIKDTAPGEAGAGLSQDWEWTGGCIYKDGAPYTDDYLYLSSNWATPELDIDGIVEDCWVYADETDGWDAGTVWPESALRILGIAS